MNPFNLRNNALFLSCWYERSRPVQIVCFSILILSILILAQINISYGPSRHASPGEEFFKVLVIVQALVLLLQGTVFAGHMAARERVSETLDFHRNSPEPVDAKIFGLIFGGTWYEWAVFFILFLVQLPFALLPEIRMGQILLWNISLMLTGIFFHTTLATIALLLTKKKRSSPFAVVFLVLFLIGPLGHVLSSGATPFFAHLFGLTAFQYIFTDLPIGLSGSLFVFDLPRLILQGLVQVPLFLLMISGMKRLFCRPNSPAWSKTHILCFCGFLFFMIAGFFVASCTHIDVVFNSSSVRSIYYYRNMPFQERLSRFFEIELLTSSVVYVVTGVIVSFLCVPSYFQRSRHIVLTQKGLIKGDKALDDGATGLFTLIGYAFMGGVFLIAYLVGAKFSLSNGITAFILLSSYVFAFGGFLEFFRLGRFRKNRIFFFTVMVVWLIFIPWVTSTVVAEYNKAPEALLTATSFSPLFGMGQMMLVFKGEVSSRFSVLAGPLAIAGVMWMLAWRQHFLVKRHAIAFSTEKT